MRELEIVTDATRAEVLLSPVRLKLLALMSEPSSAAKVAERAGMPRQIVNYHLKEMESAGFLELTDERKRGSVTERVLVASAKAYALAPQVLGPLGVDPETIRDRFSLEFLAALAQRATGELATLSAKAKEHAGRVPSMAVETSLSFRSMQERAAFAKELSNEIARLTARYHDPESSDTDTYRFVLIAHPVPRAE